MLPKSFCLKLQIKLHLKRQNQNDWMVFIFIISRLMKCTWKFFSLISYWDKTYFCSVQFLFSQCREWWFLLYKLQWNFNCLEINYQPTSTWTQIQKPASYLKKKKPCAIKIDTTKYVHKISVLLFLNFHNKNF